MLPIESGMMCDRTVVLRNNMRGSMSSVIIKTRRCITSYHCGLHITILISTRSICDWRQATSGEVELKRVYEHETASFWCSSVAHARARAPGVVAGDRACKSRARKRGWGQLGAGGPYTPC